LRYQVQLPYLKKGHSDSKTNLDCGIRIPPNMRSTIGIPFREVKMSEPTTLQNDVSLKDSVPEGGASLESILCTEELLRRPSRPPDYEKENRALVRLVSALADSPSTIFHTLAETIEDITQCDSAGLSLLTRDGKTPHVDGQRFYWPAICGMWRPHVGGGTPRNFGPCGDVLDHNRTLLFTHFERRYPYLMPVSPAAEECLLVPFYVDGKAVGTIWGIMHSNRRKFDAEDDRVMASLGKFASSAYQAWMHIEELKIEVADREKAEAEVRQLASGLEARIRRLVEANVVGIVMWNLEGAITGANEAFLHMVQYDQDDIASGRVRWKDLTPAEWRNRDEQAIAEIKGSSIFRPFEKEYLRKDGTRVPVLLGGALFESGGNDGVAFVLDLTEQRRAQKDLQQAQQSLYTTQVELARVSRLTTMGELAASIAHEVNQPLTAVTNNASACLRLLTDRNLEPEVLRRALEEIVADGTRASAVIARIRRFIKKAPAETIELDVNEVIDSVLALAGHELHKNEVLVECQLAKTLPLVRADRIQLQQVLLNLVMNSIEAMTGATNQTRVLSVESRINESGDVLVEVRDSGTGLGSEADRLFTPFFTTKANGMGMGLPISRSLIESHGGRLWATSDSLHGAVFSFTLPAAGESPS
jgi:PAS domain S-box-containing protein